VYRKLVLYEDAVIDGHAPGLGGRDLNAYIAAGISSDHESGALAEA
jgi:adenine deaminase